MARSVAGIVLITSSLVVQGCLTSVPQAAHEGDVLRVNSYLGSSGPNDRFDDGGCSRCTLLHYAAGGGRLAVARTLVDRGADVNATNGAGATPLHHACREERVEMATFLLAHGAASSLAIRDAWGNTPLILAAGGGTRRRDTPVFTPSGAVFTSAQVPIAPSVQLVEILIDAGADLATATNQGNTALHIAAYRGHAAVVATLLSRGADRTARNSIGETAEDLARRYDQTEVLEVLAAGPAAPPHAGGAGEHPQHR
jgi:ankyrin repeat protein